MLNEITFETIKSTIQNKKVIFWGASLLLESILKFEKQILPNVLGIVDNNPEKWGKMLYGYKIISPKEINKLEVDAVLITITDKSSDFYKQLILNIRKIAPDIEILPNIFHSVLKEEMKNLKMDTLNANIFNNLINNSNWVKRRDFIPIKAAADYSLLCILYIILEYFNPQNILELGLGQTSKLTSQYAQNKNKKATVQIIEHDKEWINFFSQQFNTSKNVTVNHLGLETFNYNNSINDKYKNLSDITKNNKYNLIIIDGPIGGGKKYPRTNIINLIPQNLAEDFIIILDDAQREGETNTANLIFDSLNQNNIKYFSQKRQASKKQLIIASESCKFATIY